VTTIALALLAYDLGGSNAGEILGTALALKMIVYVISAPIIQPLASKLPARAWLICLDLVRAALVLCFPFVSEIWHIYVLVILVNIAAASFTPVFQATIPALLNDEARYNRALSYTQMAYAFEQVASPTLAAVLLLVISFDSLFLINSVTFVVSAMLVLGTRFPRSAEDRSIPSGGLLFGLRAYFLTPRLRATWIMYFGVASASAMVIVNTVIYVMDVLALSEQVLGITMASIGTGSILGAWIVPRLIEQLGTRNVMLTGMLLLVLGLAGGIVQPGWYQLLFLWFAIGVGLAMVQTPVGSLVNRSCHEHDSRSLFAANFSLSHLCWLVAYPLAGYLASHMGMTTTFSIMAGITAGAMILAYMAFPHPDFLEIEHTHEEILHSHGSDHDHLHEGQDHDDQAHTHRRLTHTHKYVIDDHHPFWA
jgi:MFS family permease